MRIVCPSCNTAYDAPDSVVASGRLMRCARCRSEWMPGGSVAAAVPPAPVPAVPAADTAWAPSSATVPETPFEPGGQFTRPIEPVITAAEPVILAPFPPMPEEPTPLRKTVLAAWVGSVLVLVTAFWLAIAFRQLIMRDWPPSARAYAVLGYR